MQLEPKALAAVIRGAIDRALAPARSAFETRTAVLEARLESVPDSTKSLLAPLGERVAGLEARPPIPGPPGKDGEPGAPGAAGLGFGDLVLEQISDREVLIKAMSGDQVRELKTLYFPVPIHRGRWMPDHVYLRADVVTYEGGWWNCLVGKTKARPGGAEGVGVWELTVKSQQYGREGR